MNNKLLRDLRKGLRQISKVVESLSGSITEADVQDADVESIYKCRYDGCDKSYGHASSRAGHERKVHGCAKSQKRRQDD